MRVTLFKTAILLAVLAWPVANTWRGPGWLTTLSPRAAVIRTMLFQQQADASSWNPTPCSAR